MSVLDRFRLDGKRLFITGVSRGLGRKMALAIAEAGANAVLVGRDADSLARAAGDFRALGRQLWTIQADAATPEGCERACRDAPALGPIDVLINTIGGRRVNVPIEDESLQVWQEIERPAAGTHARSSLDAPRCQCVVLSVACRPIVALQRPGCDRPARSKQDYQALNEWARPTTFYLLNQEIISLI
jgi:hypothetical protein